MSELKPVVRCAIYTRKSSEEGLEQAFNSLDALSNGTLKTNAAVKLCRFSKAEQLEKLIRQSESF